MKYYLLLLLFYSALILAGCSGSVRFGNGSPDYEDYEQGMLEGTASYYSDEFHGRKTANGEVYNMYALTAAHKTLPFGTRVRVTNLTNGKSVILRINDRMPGYKGRIIDVSFQAAKELDMLISGIAEVKIEVLGGDN